MQPQLFNETLSEAMQDLIHQLGGPKQVGPVLWPEKDVTDARNALLNCLNPEHQQKLSLEQIDLLLELGRRHNIHSVPKFISDRYDYRIEPITPEEKKNSLQSQFNQKVEEMENILRQFKTLNRG